jgi:outer membrane biosynthesis protein TonB
MNCNFTEKISSLIDGELTPAEAREVERHLIGCGACKQVRADFLNLRSQITSFESSLSPVVQNRALKQILSAERRAPARRLQWGFGTQAVAFATLLIVGAIIGLVLYQSSRSPQTGPQVAIQTPSPAPAAPIEQDKQPAPEETPKPAPPAEQQTPDKGEGTHKPKPANPAKRPPVREPKPGEQFASVPERVRSADAETLTAMHFEKAETLLLAFRNVRLDDPATATQLSYERKRAQQLVNQNTMLRREADAVGDVQIASLLENLEPILLDIANLPNKPDPDAVRVIRERVERKNIVALLRVNSTALARALD